MPWALQELSAEIPGEEGRDECPCPAESISLRAALRGAVVGAGSWRWAGRGEEAGGFQKHQKAGVCGCAAPQASGREFPERSGLKPI